MDMLFVKAGKDRRAFAAPEGPEIVGEYRGVRDTPFIRKQIETGDLVERDAKPARPDDAPAAKHAEPDALSFSGATDDPHGHDVAKEG